jgi:hypothetical protein
MRGQLNLDRITRGGQELILVMLLILAAEGATAAQSNDRNSLNPINPDGTVELPFVDSSASAVKRPQNPLPDLVVKEISFEQAPSQIRVRVMNRGNAPSSSCFLALQSLAAEDSSLWKKQRVWTIEIPALAPGKEFSIVIDVSPLIQTNGRWRATVDRSNAVKESNENNNSLLFPTGPDGQSPRLSDLVIDHFELTNPSKGEVKIQVTNMGGGNAGTSTLRLIVWKAGKLEQKEAATLFAKVPALAAGQTTSIVVTAGVRIRKAKHSISIDITEDVK